MDITPLQSVIATAAFIILAMSLFYKWMRDLSRDLKTEIQQTRTELGQRIDTVRAEAREDSAALREELREETNRLRTEIRDLRASVETRLQGTELDRARAEAAYELLRGSAITVPTAPPDDDGN